MAVVSSHVLDSIEGISARGVRVELFRLSGPSGRARVLETVTDDEGRISESVDVESDPPDTQYELVFYGGDYFASRNVSRGESQIMNAVVFRITMPKPDARYHIPVMLSLHSYSVWWSG